MYHCAGILQGVDYEQMQTLPEARRSAIGYGRAEGYLISISTPVLLA
jgi:hypothetical protein